MTQEFLVVGLTDDLKVFEKPEICTQDEYREKQRAAEKATDCNYVWVILSRVSVEVADA